MRKCSRGIMHTNGRRRCAKFYIQNLIIPLRKNHKLGVTSGCWFFFYYSYFFSIKNFLEPLKTVNQRYLGFCMCQACVSSWAESIFFLVGNSILDIYFEGSKHKLYLLQNPTCFGDFCKCSFTLVHLFLFMVFWCCKQNYNVDCTEYSSA